MNFTEHTLTPEFKAAITRCTWDSRDKPSVVTVWVGELPVFTRVVPGSAAPYDTLTLHLEGGYEFVAENLDPRAQAPKPKPPVRRRFLKWLGR